MRYHEFSKVSLNEDIINEAFLDSLVKAVGNKAKEQISIVNNSATAAHVLYKVCSNQQYLTTMVFELKRSLKSSLKNMPDNKVKKVIISKFPNGRTLKDFFVALSLVCVVNAINQTKAMVQDQAIESVVNNLLNIENLIGQMISVGFNGIGMVMKSLGIGNAILFSVLTDINKKITAIN